MICISLEDIRNGGPDTVALILSKARGFVPVVANAACDEDLEVLALGVQAAEEQGKRLLYRTSASFVKVRAGVEDKPLLTRSEMRPGAGPGLIIVGSYVERTSRQVQRLIDSASVLAVEISVLCSLATTREQKRSRVRAAQWIRALPVEKPYLRSLLARGSFPLTFFQPAGASWRHSAR